MPGSRTAVGLLAGVGAVLVARAPDAAAHHDPPSCAVHAMEITQGVQGDPRSSDDSVALVAGRSTAIRLYVDPTCTGPVYGYVRSHDVPIEMAAANGPFTPPWPILRAREDHTLNFTFMPGTALGDGGDVTFEAALSKTPPIAADLHPPFDDCTGQGGSALLARIGWLRALHSAIRIRSASQASCFHKSVSFEKLRQPSIAAVPVDYRFFSPPEWPLDTLARNGDQMLWALWPLPDSGGGYRYHSERPIPTYLDLREGASGPDGEPTRLTFLRELEWMRCAWTGPDRPDYLYAWTPPDAAEGGHAGERVAFGDTTGGVHRATFAHEFGHIFGFKHSTLSLEGQIGWDVLARMADAFPRPHVRNGSQLIDLMDTVSPGEEYHWLPRSTYEATLKRPQLYEPSGDSDCPPKAGEEVEYFLLSGTTSLEPIASGSLRAAMVFTGTVDTAAVHGGNFQIRMLDQSEGLLYETTFSRGPGEVGFTRSLPNEAAAHRVQLLHGSELLAQLTRTEHAPSVSVSSPLPGSTLTETLRVVWTGSDEDGGSLQSFVLFKHDAGWIPLGSGTEGGTLLIDTAGLPSTTSGTLRLTVSDGLNSTSRDVVGLRLLPDRAPEVAIDSPIDGTSIAHGANIVLSGNVFDPEDGRIDGGAVTWTSDVDGVIGSGPSTNVGGHAAGAWSRPLSVGAHIVTLRATDSGGNVAHASIGITVE